MGFQRGESFEKDLPAEKKKAQKDARFFKADVHPGGPQGN